jgi:mRNA interferase MazF
MERFVKRDVVVIPFPFSDLSQAKKRPALVMSDLTGDDVILCQITSKDIKDNNAIALNDEDFEKGGLNKLSNIRPNRLFTADKNIILYKIGHINKTKYKEIVKSVIKLIE